MCLAKLVLYAMLNHLYTLEDLNQRRIKMAHFNSSGSDISNDLKLAPQRGAVLNLHWYKMGQISLKIKKVCPSQSV
jgi:hypothetical protein